MLDIALGEFVVTGSTISLILMCISFIIFIIGILIVTFFNDYKLIILLSFNKYINMIFYKNNNNNIYIGKEETNDIAIKTITYFFNFLYFHKLFMFLLQFFIFNCK